MVAQADDSGRNALICLNGMDIAVSKSHIEGSSNGLDIQRLQADGL